MHALARILLYGQIDHIQVSWVKMGIDFCQRLLSSGADDLGGTLMEETISRMAGSEWGIRMEPEQFETAIRAIGRTPRERTTTYGAPQRSRKVADALRFS
jgi:FO synthase